ncbi:uncharacterized protein K452DRAFT_295698 [Aplosporella prunicola CBS 121167]|uniref:ABC transporter domain-containing protein n=1 Tax=Aplosporella prunicola CBS 121167 TaxID=1176127 RepID=A0A6A6BN92_9PEZI|nr:uncharacterized protein K452DRAFT_295698 [Aplosporella prunicola CBS 121167]KAF2145158.1 hypothetical protein K452DRAFT_295698 [Aplosporella prunicola CBS 121167]
MESPSSGWRALHLFHQVTPLLLVAYYTVALIFDVAIRMPPKEGAVSRRWYRAAVSLIVLVIASYAAEAAVYIVHSLMHQGWWAGQHNVIFIMASILVWGSMSLILVDSATPRWLPYIGTWILGLALESVMFSLLIATRPPRDNFEDSRLVIIVLRLVLLVLLSITGVVMIFTGKMSTIAVDEESQPLLEDGANGTTAPSSNGTAYGSIAAEDSKLPKTSEREESEESEVPEDQDKDLKERQRKRLLEQGGWWGYLKGFFIFLPMIWPAKNRRMQFYVCLMLLCIAAQRALNMLIPRQMGIITNELMEDYGTHQLPWKPILLWIGLRFLGSQAGIEGLQSLVSTLLEQFSYAQITAAAFRHVMNLSMDFHTEKNSGELLKAVEQGHSLTSLMEYVFFDTAPLFLDLFLAFIYLYNLFDAYLAFTVIVVAVTYLWTTVKLTTWNREGRRLFIEKYLKENKIMYESVSNWQTVAYFNRNEFEQKRLGDAVNDHIDAYVRYNITYNLIFAVQVFIILLGLLVASFLATYRIAEGTATVGSFVTLIQYWSTLSSPLSRLANSYDRLSSDLIDAERMLQLFQTNSSIVDKETAKPLEITKGRVDFHDVSFAYDPRKATLKDINFTAKPGQTVALVGETGSGKSTILKLLLRFYDATAGAIRIDGQDIRDVTLDSLREAMGVVPQDPSMFNMSIMENIRYARLDATDEEVYAACRAAAVHDKILSFPDQYRSKVGERGVKLSGGELQRVAIARVLLKNPQLVLLDEATSAVDSVTEMQIQDAFRKLSKGRTTFVVAHRLSTIMHADLILVLSNGHIIERGTQDQLLAQGGKYVDLWNKQTSRRTANMSEETEDADVDAKHDVIIIDDLTSCPRRLDATDLHSLLDHADGQTDSKSDDDYECTDTDATSTSTTHVHQDGHAKLEGLSGVTSSPSVHDPADTETDDSTERTSERKIRRVRWGSRARSDGMGGGGESEASGDADGEEEEEEEEESEDNRDGNEDVNRRRL